MASFHCIWLHYYCRWGGVTWVAMVIQLEKPQTWTRWLPRGCSSQTSTLDLQYARLVSPGWISPRPIYFIFQIKCTFLYLFNLGLNVISLGGIPPLVSVYICMLPLYSIRQIKRYSSEDNTKLLFQSFFHLNYSIGLLLVSLKQKFQRMQNSAARLLRKLHIIFLSLQCFTTCNGLKFSLKSLF